MFAEDFECVLIDDEGLRIGYVAGDSKMEGNFVLGVPEQKSVRWVHFRLA